MSLFEQGRRFKGPGEVIRDLDTQKLLTRIKLNLHPINIKEVWSAFDLSKVRSDLLGLLGVEGHVVIGALCRQMLDFILVGQLIVVTR